MSISAYLFFTFQIIYTFQNSTPESAGYDHSGFREIISIKGAYKTMSDKIIQLNEDLIKHDLKDRYCQVIVGNFLSDLSFCSNSPFSGF